MKSRIVLLQLLLIAILIPLMVLGSLACGNSTGTDSGEIATVVDMQVVVQLAVQLKPTSLAQANVVYQADLYEKGKFRESKTVSWNQPEINVQVYKSVYFYLSFEEGTAYYGHDLSNIFSVKVHK